MKIIKLTASIILMLTCSFALADSFAPSHYCTEPYKPLSFGSQFEAETFQNSVDQYRECLEDFAAEQYREAENHKEAGDDAIEEWNNYARSL